MLKYWTDIPDAPRPIGPYSAATEINGMVFLSGQVPVDPQTSKLVGDSIEAQTEQVMKNLSAVLTHLGLGFGNVARSGIFLTSLSDFQSVNAIYERHLQGAKPARATVQVAALPLGARVEIEMIAIRGK